MTTRFTIIVVQRGDHDRQRRTIESLQKQRFTDFEYRIAASGTGDAVARALQATSGEFVTIVDAGDILHRDALASLDGGITDDVDFAYTDEDLLTARVHSNPFFKPGWSPDRLRNQPYTGRLTALRMSLVRSVGALQLEAGSAYEYELSLRVGESARRVVHIPRVLCHRDGTQDVPQAWTHDALRVLNAHLRRVSAHFVAEPHADGRSITLRPALQQSPSVSIVIPTGGTERRVGNKVVPLVRNCVESIVERSTYERYKIICVFDVAMDPSTRASLEAVAKGRIEFVPYAGEFNFSRKVNSGVLASDGEHVLLLNDDVEVVTPAWIEEMLAHSMDPGVGAVGALLHFGDGRIQHAGVVINHGSPGHSYYGYPGDHDGDHSMLQIASNFGAVTAACLMTKRTSFDQVGGFSALFPRNYNDVDYCLKVRSAGFRVVLNPRARLLHYESSSRGFAPVQYDEYAMLHARWGATLQQDPYCNPNLLPGADFLSLVDPLGRTPAEAGLVG